jgi:hypothetical protein
MAELQLLLLLYYQLAWLLPCRHIQAHASAADDVFDDDDSAVDSVRAALLQLCRC